MPFFFLKHLFPAVHRPSIRGSERKVQRICQNYPAKGRHSNAFTSKVSVKQSKSHSRQICYRSLTQRACRLPLSLFVALMASEHPEVRLYLCHQQPLLGSGGPSLAPSLSGPQALSQSPRVDIAALSCPPRAPLVPFAECTESHYCPIKALGSENEGSHKATHRGFGALTTLPGR